MRHLFLSCLLGIVGCTATQPRHKSESLRQPERITSATVQPLQVGRQYLANVRFSTYRHPAWVIALGPGKEGVELVFENESAFAELTRHSGWEGMVRFVVLKTESVHDYRPPPETSFWDEVVHCRLLAVEEPETQSASPPVTDKALQRSK